MSNTVDKRVVQMEFDNAEFENGIKQTILSLDELKKALQFNSAATNVNTLQNAFNGLSLSNIEKAVDSLQQRFSLLGIAGMTVISDLTRSAERFVMKMGQMSIGQIITGGKNRAQKVADARFALEGLFAKYEDGAERVEKAFASASAAVDGTAYGLDAAVSTTSQLATAGVELGENMDVALRAIAGSAAMANTSFEDMGNIFTKVATKGKLQGDELLSLSTRNLNAIGIVAEHLGVTMEEAQEMSRKGQISFKQFADAMNEAFGDQATRANETLTGALSNVRAALSRIGEIFYSGIIENKEFIQTVNDLRLAINAIKKAMEPLKEPFANLVSSVSKLGSAILGLFKVEGGFTGLVDKVAAGMNTLSGWIDAVTEKVNAFREATHMDDVVKEATKASEALRTLTEQEYNAVLDIFYKGVNGAYGNGADRIAGFERDEFSKESMKNIQDYLNILAASNWNLDAATEAYGKTVAEVTDEAKSDIKDVGDQIDETTEKTKVSSQAIEMINKMVMTIKTAFQSVVKVAGAVRNAFVRVFSPEGVIKNGATFLDTILNLIDAFQVTDEMALKIEDTFAGLFSIIDFLVTIFTNLFHVVGSLLGPAIKVLINVFLTVTSKIGAAAERITKFIKESKLLQIIADKLVSLFTKWYEILQIFWQKFNNLPAVKRIKDAFQEFYDAVAAKLMVFFVEAGDEADEFFGKLQEGDTSKMDKLLGKINTALENLINFATTAKDSFTELKESFDKIKNPVTDAANHIIGFRDSIRKANKEAKYVTSGDGIMGVFSNAADTFDGIGEKISGFFSKVFEGLKKIDYSKMVLVGFGTAITTLLATLSYFAFNAGGMVKTFANVGDSLTGVFKSISKRIYSKDADTSKIIRSIALAIIALAGAFYILSQCDTEKIAAASKAMAAIIGIIVAGSIYLVGVSKRVKDVDSLKTMFESVSKLILALSGSLLLLAIALKALEGITWSNIWPGLLALGTTMATLVGAILLLTKFGSDKKVKANIAMILVYAAGVYILVNALEKLAKVDVTGIEDQLTALLKIMGLVAVVMFAAKNVRIGGGLSALAVIGVIWLIELALKKILETGVTMQEVKDHLDRLKPIMQILIGITAMLAILGLTSKGAKSQAGSILAIIALLTAICGALAFMMVLSALPTYERALMGIEKIINRLMLLIITIGIANALSAKIVPNGDSISRGGIAGTLLACAVAIGMIAVAVAALGMICSEEDLRRGIMAIGSITLFVAALMVFAARTEKANYKPILAMTGMIAALVVMTMLLSLITNKAAVYQSMVVVCALLLAMGMSIAMVSAYADKINTKQIIGYILLIGVIASAVMLISKYSSGWESTIAAAGALGVVMLAIGVLTYIIYNAFKANLTQNRLKLALTTIKFISLIAVAAGAAVAAILYFGKDPITILAAAGGLALVIAALGLIVEKLNKSDLKMKNVSALLVAMAGLVLVAGAMALLLHGDHDWKQMATAAAIMVGVFAIVALGLGILGKAFETGGAAILLEVAGAIAIILGLLTVSMLALSKVIPVIIKAMQDLAKINYKDIDTKVLFELALILGLFGVTAIVAAAGITAVGLAILTLAGAVGIIIIAIGLAAKYFASLVGSIAVLVASIANLIQVTKQAGPTVKDTVKNVIIGLTEGLIEASSIVVRMMPVILANVTAIGTGILAIVHTLNSILIDILLDGLVTLVEKIEEKTPRIITACVNILIAIGNAMMATAGYFGYVGAYVMVEFMNGVLVALGETAEDTVDSIYAFGIDLIDGFANSIYNNSERLREAVRYLGNVISYEFLTTMNELMGDKLNTLIPGYARKMWQLQGEIEDYQKKYEEKAGEAQRKRLKERTDSLKKAQGDQTKEVWDYASTLGEKKAAEAGETSSLSYSNSMTESFDKHKEAIAKKLGIDPEMIEQFGGFFGTGETAGEELKKGIESVPLKSIPEAYRDDMIKQGWVLNEAGDAFVKEVTEPLKDEENVKEASGTFLDNIVNKLTGSDAENKLFSGGSTMKGFTLEGFMPTDEDLNKVRDAWTEVGDVGAIGGLAEGADVESPSKKAIKIAEYIAQGLVVKMASMITTVKASYTELGDSATEALADSMSTVTDILSMGDLENYQPTITPVVDTSQAMASLNGLNQQFDSTSFKMAADTSLSVNDTAQYSLANQVAALSDQVNKLANTDYSKLLEGVSVNVDARTNVDGTPLRMTSAKYTSQVMNDDQRAYIMAKGGRI